MKSLSFVYRKTTPPSWSISAARQCIPDVKELNQNRCSAAKWYCTKELGQENTDKNKN